MEIKYRDIVLRDMEERDIDDYVRWNTVETEWALWDAPWEMEEALASYDPAEDRERLEQWIAFLREKQPELPTSLEIDVSGCHIGMTSAYLVDENYDWISRREVQPGQLTYWTLGVDIHESAFWGRGLGSQALAAWISYFLGKGFSELCLQTWSGNTRMVHVAKKLGFVECCRKAGIRKVRGGVYDGLTFRLDIEKFRGYLRENP